MRINRSTPIVLLVFLFSLSSARASLCVAVGTSLHNSVVVSRDVGKTWRSVGNDVFGSNLHNTRSLTWTRKSGLFVAGGAGKNATVATSKDGVHWRAVAVPLSDCTRVRADAQGDVVMVAGFQGMADGFVARSVDGGLSFTLVSPKALLQHLYGMAAGAQGAWVLAGAEAFELHQSTYGLLLSRDAGNTWTPVGQTVMPVAFDVAYSVKQRRFVAVTAQPRQNGGAAVAISNDNGNTWRGVAQTLHVQPFTVTRAGPLWFALSLGGEHYATSADGTRWTNHTGSATLNGIWSTAYTQRTFIAFGQGNSGVSSNASQFQVDPKEEEPFKMGHAWEAMCID